SGYVGTGRLLCGLAGRLAAARPVVRRRPAAQYRSCLTAGNGLAHMAARGICTMTWEAVIGLEVHIQLATQSKIFSAASIAYGAEPNAQACAVDIALPGVLPVINASVVRMAVMFGLAVNARIAPQSVFARKHYFYPDLPKGYQISQFELPVVSGGLLATTLDTGPENAVWI